MKLPSSAKTKTSATATTTSLIYDITFCNLQGDAVDLNLYRGKKILFVNVASKCGFTKQYKDLQQLYDQYQEQLMIIGIPCNQFGKQEPGNSDEIQSFCERNYGVTFVITEKMKVKGSQQHPLYTWLTRKEQNGKKNSTVQWNFQKYLVDEQGQLIDYFYSITNPLSRKITKHLQ